MKERKKKKKLKLSSKMTILKYWI